MHYIISAERYNLTVEENKARTLAFVQEMLDLGLTFVAVQGVYKGTSEQSFIVNAHGMPTGWIRRKMRELDQESILVIEKDNSATLVYADGAAESLGKFQRHRGSLDGLDAYTKIAGNAWVCK